MHMICLHLNLTGKHLNQLHQRVSTWPALHGLHSTTHNVVSTGSLNQSLDASNKQGFAATLLTSELDLCLHYVERCLV